MKINGAYGPTLPYCFFDGCTKKNLVKKTNTPKNYLDNGKPMSKTIRDCSVCHEQLFCTVEQLKTHIDEHAVIDSKEWAKLRLEVDKEKRSTDAFTNSNIPSSDTEAVERVFRSKNCFQVLQVRYDEALNTNDLPALIRKRYREVARDVHPDRNMSERSTEAFRKVELSHAEATAIVSRNDQKARQRVLDLIYEV